MLCKVCMKICIKGVFIQCRYCNFYAWRAQCPFSATFLQHYASPAIFLYTLDFIYYFTVHIMHYQIFCCTHYALPATLLHTVCFIWYFTVHIMIHLFLYCTHYAVSNISLYSICFISLLYTLCFICYFNSILLFPHIFWGSVWGKSIQVAKCCHIKHHI